MRGPLTGARICVWSTDRKQQSRPNGRLCCYGFPQHLPFACQCVICGVLGQYSRDDHESHARDVIERMMQDTEDPTVKEALRQCMHVVEKG